MYLSRSGGGNGKLVTNAMQGKSQAWASRRHHTNLVNSFPYINVRSVILGGQIQVHKHNPLNVREALQNPSGVDFIR